MVPDGVDVLGDGALGLVVGEEVVGGALEAPVPLGLSCGAQPKLIAVTNRPREAITLMFTRLIKSIEDIKRPDFAVKQLRCPLCSVSESNSDKEST